ncbi:peroxiredoxin-2E-2, chloroplastic-like protein [Tanacetum coccineum]|uniref:glutaredoxin-dependent peroxiredoxin n=1 Tax=Tanacetum coccineum TaxID=301880 RepID=A0ABQ4WPS6_9ASTR
MGVDTIACVSVNDAFVMKAWEKDLNVGDEVLLLSNGNGDFTKAIGCELDLSHKPVGLGVRSRRYAMLVDDGVVKVLNLEEGGAFTNSGAKDMLNAL